VLPVRFWLIICCCILSCEYIGSRNTGDYQQYTQDIYNRGHFNGNVLISAGDTISYQGSFGLSNINPVDSLQLHSRFRLASVSKQFTATGIMKLKESGLLSYHQELTTIMPELPYQNITVRHLLTHTSGLPDYVTLMDQYWKPDLAADDPKRLISGNQDVIDMLARKKPPIKFNPGEKWEYSNTGYVLLASIIERISGQPFAQYLNEQVFQPAGMTNTSVYRFVPGYDKKNPLRVYGFQVEENTKVSNDVHYLNHAQGDGGIYSTVGDLYKWDRMLYTNEIVSQPTLQEAFTAAILNDGSKTTYGFGWAVETDPQGDKTVSHGGGWLGFRTHFYRNIDKKQCIIILTNDSSRHLKRILARFKKMINDRS